MKQLNRLKDWYYQTRFYQWLNEGVAEANYTKIEFPNRLKLGKVAGILGIISFLLMIIIVTISPEETTPYSSYEVYRTLEPFKSLGMFTFILIVVFLILAGVYIAGSVEYYHEKKK